MADVYFVLCNLLLAAAQIWFRKNFANASCAPLETLHRFWRFDSYLNSLWANCVDKRPR